MSHVQANQTATSQRQRPDPVSTQIRVTTARSELLTCGARASIQSRDPPDTLNCRSAARRGDRDASDDAMCRRSPVSRTGWPPARARIMAAPTPSARRRARPRPPPGTWRDARGCRESSPNLIILQKNNWVRARGIRFFFVLQPPGHVVAPT